MRNNRKVSLNNTRIFAPVQKTYSCSFFVVLVQENEEDFETNWDLEVNKFDDMGLKDTVLRGIYGYGFVEPSPIQQKGVLPVIQGKDTIAQVS